MAQESEDVEFLRKQRTIELGAEVSDFGKIDDEQEHMGDVDVRCPLEDPGAGRDHPAFTQGATIHEGGGITGNEHEQVGRVPEAVIPNRDPVHYVIRDVNEIDKPQRDAAKQIEADVSSGGNGGDH